MRTMTLTRRLALLGLAACSQGAVARVTLPLMLGREAADDVDPSGFLVSEKFDGVRALWDGQTLRSRSGHAATAPAWFTAALPHAPLDGELWIGRGRFESLLAAVQRAVPDETAWRAVQFLAFDQPGTEGPFEERAARLATLVDRHGCPWLHAVDQYRIGSRSELQHRLQQVVAAGGEGLMLHRANAVWQAGRSSDLLKLKPRHDAEATVVGHLPGRGRHMGRLGALRVQLGDGTTFALGTGFSDGQRLQPPSIGSVVTFSHRGFTAAGVPRFASFLRLRAP
jgi:DNA ligase 1